MKEIGDEECFYELSETPIEDDIKYNPIDQLKNEIKKAKTCLNSKKHKFYYIHEYVHFVEAIKKNIEEKKIDLLVMGTKGASNSNVALLGSYTADVITRVKCPLLIIPAKAVYTAPKNIVFPTDFNIFYKQRVLNTLTEILRIKDALLNVLYVSKNVDDLTSLQKKNRSYLQDYLLDKPHSFYFISEKTVDQAITNFVETNEVHMIAMIAKNLNFFQRILFRPTVEKLSYHTSVPFLVLHE
jgi:nucleotide-binding universal stress UspA family protein